MQTLDIIVLIGYTLAVVLFGCFFSRKNTSSAAFTKASGRLPGWAVGLSIFGTYLSSNTFLGVPGKAYATNWNAYIFSLTIPIAALIAIKYFLPYYRKSGEISAYTHLEKRFGPWARNYSVVCYLLTQIARMGAILFGVAIGMHTLTGWDIRMIILITGTLVTVYTLLGGIEAVIWTDVVQSIVLMLAAVLIMGLLLFEYDGGPTAALGYAWDEGKMSLGSWKPDFTSSTIWVVLLFGLFINLNNFGVDQSYVQRYHTTKDLKEARKSVLVGALLYVPVSLLFFVIGALLYSHYHPSPEVLQEIFASYAAEEGIDPSLVKEADIADRILPHYITHRLPAGISGLIIAAIFAAAMSSVDTSLNSSSTIVLRDVYERYFNTNASEKQRMRVLFTTTIIWGIIGTLVALAMIGQKSILDIWWKLSGVFSGGMLGLFLLGMIARSAKNAHALIAVMIGLLAIIWMTFSPGSSLPSYLQNALHSNLIVVVSTLVIFLVGSLISKKSQS